MKNKNRPRREQRKPKWKPPVVVDYTVGPLEHNHMTGKHMYAWRVVGQDSRGARVCWSIFYNHEKHDGRINYHFNPHNKKGPHLQRRSGGAPIPKNWEFT